MHRFAQRTELLSNPLPSSLGAPHLSFTPQALRMLVAATALSGLAATAGISPPWPRVPAGKPSA